MVVLENRRALDNSGDAVIVVVPAGSMNWREAMVMENPL
jgi:hypothetical protein